MEFSNCPSGVRTLGLPQMHSFHGKLSFPSPQLIDESINFVCYLRRWSKHVRGLMNYNIQQTFSSSSALYKKVSAYTTLNKFLSRSHKNQEARFAAHSNVPGPRLRLMALPECLPVARTVGLNHSASISSACNYQKLPPLSQYYDEFYQAKQFQICQLVRCSRPLTKTYTDWSHLAIDDHCTVHRPGCATSRE